MAGAVKAGSAQAELLEEQQAQAAYQSQRARAEMYGLAVLAGEGLAVVYVIGTLVLNCVGL